jgi:pyridoxine kinase
VALALSMTASAVHAVLEETYRAGSREITLVPAQQSIVEPPLRFEARQVR